MGKKEKVALAPRFTEEEMTEIIIPARQVAHAVGGVVTSVIDYFKKNSINNEKAVRQAFMDLSDEVCHFMKEPEVNDG